MSMTSVQSVADSSQTGRVKMQARSLGFDLVGVASAEPSQFRQYLRNWIDAGKAGEMDYLGRRFEERVDPGTFLPGAQSVVCVAMNYHAPLESPPPQEAHRHGRVARYALGDDYHEIIKDRLHDLADWMRETWPGTRTRCGVDTAPVLERELAARAGIGWIGKNTCVIHPRVGSWLLLGEVITTLQLSPDSPETDHCGTCTRCIDACPTVAITAPYELDARRCISYLTIEHRGDIPAEFQAAIGNWVYGCDICQDVCPHNARAPEAADAALRPRNRTGTLDVEQVLRWSDDDYRAALRGTAMKRVKLPLLKRNASIVAGNLAKAGGSQ